NIATVASASSDPATNNNSAAAAVTVTTPVSIIIAAGATLTAESFSPPDGAIEPGERVTVSLGLANIGSQDTANLVATLQASGGVLSPSGPQSYGVLVHGGPSAARPFRFTEGAGRGGFITA